MRFNEMYPKDRFYAADLQGKHVTLTFKAVTREVLAKGTPSEKTMPVWHFVETDKSLPAVLTNGVCARAMFGDDSDGWIGHKITLYPAPDTSGLAEDGLCIRVAGSPELASDLVFRAQIGRTKKTFTLVPTRKGGQVSPDMSDVAVDDETGEVQEEAIGFDAPADESPVEVPGKGYEEAVAERQAKEAAGPKANALLIGKLKAAATKKGMYEAELVAEADREYGVSELKELSKMQAESLLSKVEGEPEGLGI